MARSAKQAGVDTARSAVEHALDLLREDPPRLKRLLRETAGLADDLASVLEDANEHDVAKKVSRVAKTLRGGALLPAGMSIALLRKALEKLVAAAG
jgi:hypothetical protein